jgi:hypothetical protein
LDLPYDGVALGLAWAAALALLWWPRLSRTPFALLLAAIPGLWIGEFGQALGLGVAVVLVWAIARELNRLEDGSQDLQARPAATADPVFREVCRARRYDRPLALMALQVPVKTADVAALLREATREPDLVTEHGRYLLATFPEIGAREIPALAERIEKLVNERLGLAVRIGSAAFRDDAITYDALIRVAFEGLEDDPLVPGGRREDTGEPHRRSPDHAQVA